MKKIISTIPILGLFAMTSCNYSLFVKSDNVIRTSKGILLLSDLSILERKVGDSSLPVSRDTLMPDIFIPMNIVEKMIPNSEKDWISLLASNKKSGMFFFKSNDCGEKIRDMYISSSDTISLIEDKSQNYYSSVIYALPVEIYYIRSTSITPKFYYTNKNALFYTNYGNFVVPFEEGYIQDIKCTPLKLKFRELHRAR